MHTKALEVNGVVVVILERRASGRWKQRDGIFGKFFISNYKLFRHKVMAVVRVTTEMLKVLTGDGDVVAWLQKVKLVARLQGVKDLATFLPLYLEGDALALFLQLSEQEQADRQT